MMTKSAIYTPRHTRNAVDFMSRRNLGSHGEFFLPHLWPGLTVLDCGCGPGSITLDIAERIGSGSVVGVDFADSQIELAQEAARLRRFDNVSFQAGDVHSLPFPEDHFDRVFSHALLEHLFDPVVALREFHRVLKPGGVIGVCCPDWGGFILSPSSDELTEATKAYASRQDQNGGDTHIGRKLGQQLNSAGFQKIRLSARYENFPNPSIIGEYLAIQLEDAGDVDSAVAFRNWCAAPNTLFALSWVSCVAEKPMSEKAPLTSVQRAS